MDTPFTSITYLETPNALADRERDRLVLIPQENRISYSIVSPDRHVRLSRSFINDKHLASSVFFRLVLEREGIQANSFDSCTVLSANPQFTLIPDSELRPGRDDAFQFTRILLDESVFKQEVGQVMLPPLEASIIFVAPLPIRYLWDEYLPAYQLSHVAAPLIEMACLLRAENPSHLLIQLFDSMAIIVACQGGKISFCNSFRFRAEMDIVYFLHSVRQVTDLQDDDLPVFALGEFDREGQAFRNLKTYVPQLQIPDILEHKGTLNGSADAPFWKYGIFTL